MKSMTAHLSDAHLKGGLALALLVGTALLSGCGPDPAPVTSTTTTTDQTTTRPAMPPPMIGSTTVTRTQQFQ